jgi:phosphomannomutase
VYPVLQKAGFDVRLYGPQANYDGNFTNVTNHISNPEAPEASDKVSTFAVEEDCDIVVTTDPDADRLGVVVVNKDKTTTLLNGNQTAALIAYHILETLKKAGGLNAKQFIGKTIVTTDMLQALADDYGVELKGNLLVGFKYIGELIKLYVDDGDQEFLFGGEESFGGLVGTYARDKDAASSALMIAELSSVAKQKGKTLLDVLDELYQKYGYYSEVLDSTYFPGAEGFSQMKHIMNELRANPPTQLGSYKILKVRDYITGHEVPGRAEDVLRFEFSADGSDRVTIRPSGTEPKVKIYVQTKTLVDGDLTTAKAQATTKVVDMLKACKDFLK